MNRYLGPIDDRTQRGSLRSGVTYSCPQKAKTKFLLILRDREEGVDGDVNLVEFAPCLLRVLKSEKPVVKA